MADERHVELLKQGAKTWNAARSQGLVAPRPDLTSADLVAIKLIGVDLDGADLSNADLTGAIIPYARLHGAKLEGAVLRRAVLTGAKANGASLRGADLREADISDSAFDMADFMGADLRHAIVDRCRLVGARLAGVLTAGNLDRAIHDNAAEVFASLPQDRTLSIDFAIDSSSEASERRVAILVEGVDVFSFLGQIGFPPKDLFSPTQPLVPTDPPQRVAVYRCNCGEAGCACIAPVIERVGTEVHWTDFRDFTGVYITPDTDPHPDGGQRLPIPDLRFDACAYEVAISRGRLL